MDVFFAFLTALFFCLWTSFGQRGKMVRAQREAGSLLRRIVLSRLGQVWEWVFVPLMLFVIIYPFDRFEKLDATWAFLATFLICLAIEWRPWRKNVMDVCDNGIVLDKVGLIPWNNIECCQWMRGRGKLWIQRRQQRDEVECRIASDQVAAATEILSQYVEVRTATRGQAIAPPTRNPSGTAPVGGCSAQPILRSERLAKQFGFLAVISAFCWLSVVYQDCQQQKKVLAKFAAFQPEVDWIGFDIYRVDFSKCANKPGDHDLVLLEWLEHLGQLNLDGSPISDAGLKHLYNMKTLQSVSLADTQVTQKGVDDLKQAIPKVDVWWPWWSRHAPGDTKTHGEKTVQH